MYVSVLCVGVCISKEIKTEFIKITLWIPQYVTFLINTF